MRHAFCRNGEEIEAEHSGQDASVDPKRESASPEEPKKQWDQDDAGAGDEAGLGGTCVLQAGGLKSVAAEHEKAESSAGEQLPLFQRSKHMRAKRRHEESCKSEANGEKNENRRVAERIFDDNKGRAPEQAAQGKRKIGLETFGHAFEIRYQNAEQITKICESIEEKSGMRKRNQRTEKRRSRTEGTAGSSRKTAMVIARIAKAESRRGFNEGRRGINKSRHSRVTGRVAT